MNSVEIVILALLASGVLAFFLARWNAKAGSFVTIFASFFAFVIIAYYGYGDGMVLDNSNDILSFTTFHVAGNELGLFFATIITFIFSMVSFFNPFFIEQYKYKAVYPMLFLFGLAGTVGVFFTNNLLSLFLFFEFVVWTSMFLIPMGKSKRAAAWYYGFSALGSFALLFAVMLIYVSNGNSFNIIGIENMSGGKGIAVFVLFMVAAFSKIGGFPFHIWLPIVHGNAPHPFSPILSGALVKLGAFVSILGLAKLTTFSSVLSLNGYINMYYAHYIVGLLGAVTIVFGTLMAIREDDAKKLLAYSSVSNGGYMLVAFAMLNSQAMAGGLYHVLVHALATTAAFLAIGAVSYYTGTSKMKELGGIIHKMPVTYTVYLIAIISMAGIPPMGGFISKWLIFQSVIDNGMIFIGIATFFGSIGSFLYVFRPLAALFLGQELPEYKDTVKEAPFLMMLPMLILSALNIYTGVLPNYILGKINLILLELNMDPLILGNLTIQGNNGVLNPAYIAIIFGVGVIVAFVIFILLKKSYKISLMDTYTSGNFVHTEQHLHYTMNFYAPLERLYEKYIHIMKNFYDSLANKVKEFGSVVRYYFFSNKPEVTVFFILIVITFLLWGDVL